MGVPMCDRWYERPQEIRPWDMAINWLRGCHCGVGTRKPASGHGPQCPVRIQYQEELQRVLLGWP